MYQNNSSLFVAYQSVFVLLVWLRFSNDPLPRAKYHNTFGLRKKPYRLNHALVNLLHYGCERQNHSYLRTLSRVWWILTRKASTVWILPYMCGIRETLPGSLELTGQKSDPLVPMTSHFVTSFGLKECKQRKTASMFFLGFYEKGNVYRNV